MKSYKKLFFSICSITVLFLSSPAQALRLPFGFYNELSMLNGLNGSEIFRITPNTVLKPNRLRIQNNFIYFRFENAATLFFTNEMEYAISRLFSVQVTTPFVLQMKEDNLKTERGLGKIQVFTDIRWFLERSFASILRCGLELPTATINDSAMIGFNTPDFILQLEQIFLSRYWFIDFALLSLIPTKDPKRQRGIQFGHRLDFSRQFYFGDEPEINILVGIIMNSAYGGKNTLFDVIDQNSGGFTLLLGPLFSISRKDLLWDIRPSFPISQNLFSKQAKTKYVLATSFQAIF